MHNEHAYRPAQVAGDKGSEDDLNALLAEAAAAPPGSRIEFRNAGNDGERRPSAARDCVRVGSRPMTSSLEHTLLAIGPAQRVLDQDAHHHGVSLMLRALLVGVGFFGLFTVWTVSQVSVPPGLLLTALAFGGLLAGWLWMIKIGRDAGNV